MSLLLALLLAAGHQKSDPVLLSRVFKPNTKLSYAVRSSLSAELRGSGLKTWLPSDLDINYDFTLTVEALKADGIAVVRYRRPTVDEVIGETFDAPAKTNKLKTDFDDRMTLSPFNEILDTKDLAPKKKPWVAGPTTKLSGRPIVGPLLLARIRSKASSPNSSASSTAFASSPVRSTAPSTSHPRRPSTRSTLEIPGSGRSATNRRS